MDILNAIAQCKSAGNNVTSCYPTNQTVIVQNSTSQWQSTDTIYFVWNSRLPLFTQTNTLQVSLYRGDFNGDQLIRSWPNTANPTHGDAGLLTVLVDDVLRSLNDSWTPGTNISTPMYFTIAPSASGGGGDVGRQATFELVLTGLPSDSSSSSSDGDASTTHAAPGAIAGIVVGGIAVLVLVVVVTWMLVRRYSALARARGDEVDLKEEEETGSVISWGDEKEVQGTQ
ncbi:unnamed protein product [Peniophora sp. CBMAI 1063]|nr:unnamed protein product [Peniophora sp. CBMAI 1063]